MISRFSNALRQALAADRLLVTPNNRMARTLVRAHDAAQRAAGVPVWPTAQALPYAAFVERLWRQLSTVMPLPRCLNARACRMLWSEIVEQDAEASLYATGGATALAQETWRLLHLWRAPDDETPWRHWRREGGGITHDTARFARWAARYHEKLSDGGFIDEALMPDFIARHASRLQGVARGWTMAGFDDHTPQAWRLIEALRAAGFEIDEASSLDDTTGKTFQYRARHVSAELSDALSWAWQQVHCLDSNETNDRQVAIVIPSLAAQERAVRWQVEDVLPDSALCNVSLGEPLAQKALVATALDLLTLFDQPLPAERVAALLQSPYLPGDVRSRVKRAALARQWIERGQRDVSWREMLKALVSVDPMLSARWREVDMLPTQAATGSWPRHLLSWWQALGWPGSQTLDSVDYQVREAWRRCLEALPTLEAVAPKMTRRTLAQTLRQWAAETLFQPESGRTESNDTPIQILGALEAAGLPFDALWVTGLDSDSWPPSVVPQPLLPLAWQRAQRMPHTSVEQTLAYADRMQAHWQRMGREVVLSYPAERDGQPTTASPLLTALPLYPMPIETLKNRMMRMPEVTLETLDDSEAPPVARDQEGRIVEAIRHGSSVLEQQSDCPFKAFVSARLRVSVWPDIGEGLSPIERGHLVHAVLQKLWQRLETQMALLALDATTLDQQIDTAYQDVVAEGKAVAPERWRNLPSAMATMEREHIAALLRGWCDIERTRAPFQVAHTEKALTLELAGMTYTLRADRIDALENGGVALIDYKTGRAEPTKGWFDARPSPVQLGVYALAWQALSETTAPVKALVYAHLREDGAEVRGMTDDTALWPKLETVARFGFGTTDEAQQRWREIFTALTQAFLAGDARVAPRRKRVCERCDLKPLCRIGASANGDESEAEEGHE
ncbi:MAG: PD-(D/E)XK nuclease family protein [Proteobacteria bacterium]|nr:PD-(D/E)XK nuclease family protein [Pseudomonadota bacterium]MCL2307728.1 PD-(D/E)XK nuclease family protein [Pseudomonadota bacterium]